MAALCGDVDECSKASSLHSSCPSHETGFWGFLRVAERQLAFFKAVFLRLVAATGTTAVCGYEIMGACVT
jgi:hypothetical protein